MFQITLPQSCLPRNQVQLWYSNPSQVYWQVEGICVISEYTGDIDMIGQLVMVDSFTLFTLLWPGLKGRSVFLKKPSSVFLPVSKYMSNKKGVCASALSLLSNTVKQEFVSKWKLCKHFCLFQIKYICIICHSYYPSIPHLSSVSGSSIEIYPFCSKSVWASPFRCNFVLKVRDSTVFALIFWEC